MLQSIVHVCLAGLSTGMFIWLVASGLTLIFGVLGVLNFAHGSLYMLGAYVSFALAKALAPHFFLALVLAPLVVALIGWCVERFFIRYVYGLAATYQLLLTFAFVLIFDDAVKLTWGGAAVRPELPAILERLDLDRRPELPRLQPLHHRLRPGGGARPLGDAGGDVVGAHHPRLLLDREMASALGVRVPALYSGVFAFGSWLGALGGALSVPYVGLMTPGMGETVIIDAFVVAVIGGLGSLKGAFLGALVDRRPSSFGTRFFPTFDMFLTFILMAAVLLWRPHGLFGASR